MEVLQADEKALLDIIRERLIMGQRQYGVYKAGDANDKRDKAHELLEEILDGLVYTAMQVLELKRLNGDLKK